MKWLEPILHGSLECSVYVTVNTVVGAVYVVRSDVGVRLFGLP